MKYRNYRLLLHAYAVRKKRLVEIRWGTAGYMILGTVFTVIALANAFNIHAEPPTQSPYATQPLSTQQAGIQQATSTQSARTLAQDTFQRPDALQGWRIASDGQTWQGDMMWLFRIQQGMGVISGGPGKATVRLGPISVSADVACSASISSFQNGAASISAMARYGGPDMWDKAALDSKTLSLIQHGPAGNVTLASIPFVAVDGAMYTIRLRSNGQALDAKAWFSGNPEPEQWMVHATDTVLHSGPSGMRFILATASVVRVSSFSVRSVSE